MEISMLRILSAATAVALVSLNGVAANAAIVTQNYNYIPLIAQPVTIGAGITPQFLYTGSPFGSAAITANDIASGVTQVSAVPYVPDSTDPFTSSVDTGGFGGGGAGYYGLRFMIAAGLTYGYATLTNNGFTLASITYEDAPVAAGGVPEPATWALMICGFGLVGAAARRRRQIAEPA